MISIAYAVVPVYETSGGRETAIAANGWWVALLLVAPLIVTALPWMTAQNPRRGVWWAAAIMTIFAVATGFTIGTPYLLPAVLLWLAGEPRPRE